MKQSRRIVISLMLLAALVLSAAQLAGQDAPVFPDPRRTIPEKIEPPKGSQQKEQISTQDINNAKEALRAKGLNPGPRDGIWDSRTQQALRDFQQANQLPATGDLDAKTAEKLGITIGGQTGPRSSDKTVPPIPSPEAMAG